MESWTTSDMKQTCSLKGASKTCFPSSTHSNIKKPCKTAGPKTSLASAWRSVESWTSHSWTGRKCSNLMQRCHDPGTKVLQPNAHRDVPTHTVIRHVGFIATWQTHFPKTRKVSSVTPYSCGEVTKDIRSRWSTVNEQKWWKMKHHETFWVNEQTFSVCSVAAWHREGQTSEAT